MPNYIFIITEDMTGRFLGAYTKFSDATKFVDGLCDECNHPYNYIIYEYDANGGIPIHDYKYDWKECKWNEYASTWGSDEDE